MKTAYKIVVFLFLLSTRIWASSDVSPWYTLSADKKATINVELFLSSTCPHCHKADAFFADVATKNPSLNIKRNVINEDKDALLRFNQLLSAQHMDDFSVPSIFFCDSRWLGFADAGTTGKDLMHAINYCKQQIEKNGTLTPATVDTLRHWANANKFDSGMIENPSVFSYIVTIAITDAFSPCAFFCFAGFMAFLFVEERREKQITAGLLFTAAVVMMHYFQQAHASGFYHLLPWLRIPAILLGGLLIYFVVQHHKKQTQPVFYFAMAFLVGLFVTAYQQTCIMNWSYIFQQWLSNQQLITVQRGFYQILYQAFYALPLLLTLVIYLTLLKIKRIANWQPRLFVIGLLFLSAIALCFIVYPALLSYLTTSMLVVLILVICARFLNLA